MNPTKLATIRTKIADKKAEYAVVERAPQSRDETEAWWLDYCKQAAAGRARVIAHHLVQRADGQPLTVATPRTGEALDLLPVLAALLGPDRLIELLQPHLAALPEGMTASERRERLADLDRQITLLEHTEMDLIEQAEAAGVPFAWRADQSPAVVLRVSTQA